MTLEGRFAKALRKRAKKGLRGYPVATIAFYGPDDSRASKVAVGIVVKEGAEATFLERWHSDIADVRADPHINEKILTFIRSNEVKSVVLVDALGEQVHLDPFEIALLLFLGFRKYPRDHVALLRANGMLNCG